MSFKKEIRLPIVAFFLISLGGLLLHVRIHPVTEDIFNWIPVFFCAAGVLVLPFLFNHKRTVAAAYLINFSSVVIGTIMMALHSVEHWEVPVTVVNVILQSTLADIIILGAKLPLAHLILRYHFPGNRSPAGEVQT